MSQVEVMAGAEPCWFGGNEIGCLVCHGFTGTVQTVHPLGASLAARGGFTVSMPRLTGHGTRPEDMAECTAEDWIRDVEAALETLRQRCAKVFCIGLSMGGTLALYVAAMHPEMVAGAVTINGAVFSNNADMAALAFATDQSGVYNGRGPDIRMPGVVKVAYPGVPSPPIRQLYALVAVTRDLLPRIVCPTLIFQSRTDYAVPPENGPYILGHITTEDKQLLWLENSYHVATLDHDKEYLAEETLRFVRAH
jgi:carboxylesterase